MMTALLHLAMTFGMLSLLAVGGGTAVLPEMQTVLAHQFNIDHTTFVHIYSIGQLAPGPNMLMVLVFGEDVARLGGVFRVTQGLAETFGDTRCFDTPLAESGGSVPTWPASVPNCNAARPPNCWN